MVENKFIQIRLNMSNPLHKEVWDNVSNYDREEFKSYSDLAVQAFSDFFTRRSASQNEPFLETRKKEDEFINKITDGVIKSLEQILPKFMLSCLVENSLHSSIDFNTNSEANVDMDDIDWDFVGKG